MKPKPVRLQRSRRKGARLVSPNGLPIVCVTRGTVYGNRFQVGHWYMRGDIEPRARFRFTYTESYLPDPRFTQIKTKEEAVEWFKWYLSVNPALVEDIKKKVRGCNVACWCKLTDCCHGDVVMEVANS